MNFNYIKSIFFLLLLTTSSLNAQINLGTRLGLNSFSEINLEVLSPTKTEGLLVYSSISHYYRGFNFDGLGCGTLWPVKYYDNGFNGAGFKFGITKTKYKKGNKKYITLALLIRRFEGISIVEQSHCSEISRQYSYISTDIGFTLHKDRVINKSTTFYWSLSFASRNRKGKTINPNSSLPGEELKTQSRVIFDIGFRKSFLKPLE